MLKLNKKSLRTVSTLLGAAALISQSANAQTAPAVPAEATAAATTSQAKAEDLGIAKRISLSITTQFVGPSLGEFNHTVRDASGALDGSIFFDNTVFGGFKVNDSMTAVVAVPFALKVIDGWSATLEDVSLRAKFGKAISAGNFSMSADARLYLPTASSSRDKNMMAGLRATQFMNYDLGTSKFSMGLLTYERLNLHSGSAILNAEGKPTQVMVDLYAGPSVNYQILDNLQASLLLEADVTWKRGGEFKQASLATDLEPGISWDITPNLNFNPYINIYPFDNAGLNNTTINFFFTAKFL